MDALTTLLREAGYADLAFTSAPMEAEALARRAVEEGTETILVAGGDGTLNEVVNGMAGSRARLGILPAGCRNVLARELGIPPGFEEAMALIAVGKTRRIDLGEANRRYFAVMIGVGFDAAAVREAENNLRILKKFLRGYAYHLAGLRTLLRFRVDPFPVAIDGGKTLSGSAVVVANGHFYGGSHKLVPGARIDDGQLDLCLFEKGGRLDYVRYFLGVLSGRHQDYPDVSIRRVTGVKIATPGLPIHVDGDFAGFTPVEVRVHLRALEIFASASGE